MKNFLVKIKTYAVAHKIISSIILIVVIGGGYSIYKKNTSTTGEVRYVLGTATKNTVISSITGTGEVSALNQISIQPQVSGLITYVNVKPGDSVGDGRLLFTIDDTNAQQAVTNAEASLQSAQINLSKIQLQNSSTNLNSTLAKGYDDGFSTVSNTFLDLPGIMSGLNDMFFTSTISKNGQWNVDWYQGQVSASDNDAVIVYKQNFTTAYNTALKAYNDNFNNYKSTSRSSDNNTIDAIVSQTYDTIKLISSAIKSAGNYIDFVNASIKKNNGNVPAIISDNLTTLGGYTSQTNNDLQNLLSAKTQIQTNKDSFTSSDLDVQSSQLSVTQAQNSLQQAKNNLAYYSIHAPFSGIIASVPVQKGANVGSGTTLATIITTAQLASISLNEVDVSKIKLGEQATITFDAIPGLTITGKVSQIDSIGTVSQGVVNYNVQISFDTNDTRIKPGMSLNAAIITNVEQNVLTVPNSAVKTQGGSSYVQIFSSPLPTPLPGVQGSPSLSLPIEQTVTIGISDNTQTQILSGLNEGDQIVTRAISPSTTTTTTTAPSLFGSTTNRAGAGATRAPVAK
jgi:RND family efflux transporter MFP subunit